MMRDIAQQYASKGYMPLPANADRKMPLCKWKELYDHYQFEQAWAGYDDAPGIGLILRRLFCVDFDSHGDEPNGMTYYKYLEKEYPYVFKGAIIEKTQSNGRHVYYRWMFGMPAEQWLVPVRVQDQTVQLEVKTGHRLAFCYPSLKNGGPGYEIIQGGFDKIRPEQLPPLPSIFRYYPPKPPVRTFAARPRKLKPEDMGKALEAAVDMYRGNAGVEGKMHNGAVGLARYLAGLGYGHGDVESALRDYERSGHRRYKPGEQDGLVDDAFKNPDREPIPPRIN